MSKSGRRCAEAAACIVVATAMVSAAPCEQGLLTIPPTRHPVYFSEQVSEYSLSSAERLGAAFGRSVAFRGGEDAVGPEQAR